jgi:23S rRNA pseudouridine2604 synthase
MIRLAKLMATRGLCSRREAEKLIKEALVLVNGQVHTNLGEQVPEEAEITLLSKAQRQLESKVTVLMNKPVGFVSTQPEKGYRAAIELLRGKLPKHHLQKLSVAGRLDIDSRGLLVLTQDGRIAKQLIGADTKVEKEYVVFVQGEITEAKLKRLRHGLSLEGKALKPAKVSQVGEQKLSITLKEGKKRQVRRMCELVELKVTSLIRVRIGQVKLGKLKEGQFRYLEPHEKF